MSIAAAFTIIWTFAAAGVGGWLVVKAEAITERRVERAREGAKRYGHRPVLFRPKYANSRPTVAGTRMTGVGFCVLACIGIAVLLQGGDLSR